MMDAAQRKAGIFLNFLIEGVKILTVLFYTPVMLRLLGQEEYGLYQMVSAVVSYLGVLSFGFGSAYVRYDSHYRVNGDRQGLARLNGMFLLIFSGLALLVLLCGGVMIGRAAWIFSLQPEETLPKVRTLLAVLVCNLALTLVNTVFDCHITAREHFLFQRLLRLLQTLLSPFLALPLLLLGYGASGVVWVSLLLTMAVLLGNLYYCRKRLHMEISFHALPVSLLGELWGFTFFLFLNEVIDQVNWNVDKMLLGRICGTAEVAVYGIGSQIHGLYMQLSIGISSVFLPKVNRMVAGRADRKELTALMIQVGRVQAGVLGLVLTGFLLFGRDFLALWAGKGYENAYAVALLLMVPVSIPLIQNLGLEIQRAENRHRARCLVCLCLAMGNVVLSIRWIPKFGCIGAAAGTAAALLLGNCLFMNWYYENRLGLDMRWFWREILSFMPAWAAAYVSGWLVCRWHISGWKDFLLAVLVYMLIYGLLLWRFGMRAGERQQLRRILSGKKKEGQAP